MRRKYSVLLPGLFAAAVACTVACSPDAPTPTVPSTAPPIATPPPATQNAAPTVSVAFAGASTCMPHGSISCALDVKASASDPDGDTLTYAWSGCATGSSSSSSAAVCTVKTSGPVTATVTVDDGHGHAASASASGEGEVEPVNRPPSVAVVFPAGMQCAPQPGAPCTVEVAAQASDPDGDTLHYSWSGCATGRSERAHCTVPGPGSVVATVTVDDQHAHVVSASGTASGGGTNRPPDVSIGYVSVPAGNPSMIVVLGNVVDPEDGFLCGREFCGGISTTGSCGSSPALQCSCLAGLEALLTRTTAAGTCSITFEVKDKWGTIGRPTVTIDVATLKVLSHSNPASLQVVSTSKR